MTLNRERVKKLETLSRQLLTGTCQSYQSLVSYLVTLTHIQIIKFGTTFGNTGYGIIGHLKHVQSNEQATTYKARPQIETGQVGHILFGSLETALGQLEERLLDKRTEVPHRILVDGKWISSGIH